MSDPEQSISQAQIAAAQAQSKRGEGLHQHHKWNVSNLDERILFFLGMLVVIGLLVLWLAVPSALVVYGSLGVIILLIVLWGVVRIRRVDRIQKERENQVKAMQSDASGRMR